MDLGQTQRRRKEDRTAQALPLGSSLDPSSPFLQSPLPTNTHKFKTYKGRTGDKGQYRSKKTRRPGVEVPTQNLESLPHMPPSPERLASPGTALQCLPHPSLHVDLPTAQQGQWLWTVTRGGGSGWGLPRPYFRASNKLVPLIPRNHPHVFPAYRPHPHNPPSSKQHPPECSLGLGVSGTATDTCTPTQGLTHRANRGKGGGGWEFWAPARFHSAQPPITPPPHVPCPSGLLPGLRHLLSPARGGGGKRRLLHSSIAIPLFP